MSHKDDFIPDGKHLKQGRLFSFFPEDMSYTWAIDTVTDHTAIIKTVSSQPRELFAKTAKAFNLGKFKDPPNGKYEFPKNKMMRAKFGLLPFKRHVEREVSKDVLKDGIVILQTNIENVTFILTDDAFLIEVILNVLYARK